MAEVRRMVQTELEWQEIRKLIKDANALDTLPIGSEIKMTLMTGEPVTMVVIDIKDGAATLISKNCLKNRHQMNQNWTNEGGWRDSELRKLLNGEIYESLPEDLKAIVKLRKTVQTVQVNGEDQKTECEDKVWLPSEYEVFGEEWAAEKQEGEEQYEYFKDKRNRIKNLGDDGEESCTWWLSSPNASITTTFCHVSYYGYANVSGASTALGVPLCLTIE